MALDNPEEIKSIIYTVIEIAKADQLDELVQILDSPKTLICLVLKRGSLQPIVPDYGKRCSGRERETWIIMDKYFSQTLLKNNHYE
jgi:hypothetical protein